MDTRKGCPYGILKPSEWEVWRAQPSTKSSYPAVSSGELHNAVTNFF